MTDYTAKMRQGLHPVYLPKFNALRNILGAHWQPYSGVRSFANQTDLYNRGRSPALKSFKIVTNAQAGESSHNWGCGSDWAPMRIDPKNSLNNSFYWPDLSDPIWREYEDAVKTVGLVWGGDFKMKDGPHNELPIKGTWAKMGELYRELGEQKAMLALNDLILVK